MARLVHLTLQRGAYDYRKHPPPARDLSELFSISLHPSWVDGERFKRTGKGKAMPRLRLISSAVLMLGFVILTPALAQQGPATQTFCVSGTSTGAGWSWGVVSGGSLQCHNTIGGLPKGAGCADFASAFVNSINDTTNAFGCTAEVSGKNPCCFTVSCSRGFNFWVGNAEGTRDGTSCDVTNSPDGCSFNPILFYTTNPAVVAH